MAAAGCHHAFGQSSNSVYDWQLDPDHHIRLNRYWSSYPEWADSELTRSELSVAICDEDAVVQEQVIVRRDATRQRRNGPVPFGEYEARADSGRQRFWIVDKESRRVIAAHDVRTGNWLTSGEPAPGWAKPDEGEVLALMHEVQ